MVGYSHFVYLCWLWYQNSIASALQLDIRSFIVVQLGTSHIVQNPRKTPRAPITRHQVHKLQQMGRREVYQRRRPVLRVPAAAPLSFCFDRVVWARVLLVESPTSSSSSSSSSSPSPSSSPSSSSSSPSSSTLLSSSAAFEASSPASSLSFAPVPSEFPSLSSPVAVSFSDSSRSRLERVPRVGGRPLRLLFRPRDCAGEERASR